jgi:peptidase M23-like protein
MVQQVPASGQRDCGRAALPAALAVLGPLVLAAAAPARAADPRPPQVAVGFTASPAPIMQGGVTKLFYELTLINVSPLRYTIASIAARGGDATASFAGVALERIVAPFGKRPQKPDPKNLVIEGGHGAIVYLELDLGHAKAPAAITHELRIADAKGEIHTVSLAPEPVLDAAPVVVAPPLRGDWIAGDAVNNGMDAAHRRAAMVEGGQLWLAQRYAIDWVQGRRVHGRMTTFDGREHRNESYFCYGQAIYSVADGTVVDASDGLADNVPHSGNYAEPIDFNNAAGNHVVVEIGPARYVLYAHMKPGSVRVKAGQSVRTGDVLGNVGDTGSSTEPHLHMHIDDHPSFLGGNSVPYVFASGMASGPTAANVSSSGTIAFGPIGPQKPFTDDYPDDAALVSFQ